MDDSISLRPPRWALITISIIGALVILALIFDWNWLRGPIERRVQAATGRELKIGDLDVDLGRTVHVKVRQVTFANAAWADQKEMVALEYGDVGVAFWPLLRGDLIFPSVSVDRLRVWLERNPQGDANWIFEKRPPRASSPLKDVSLPQIDQLTVQGGEIHLVEPALKTRLSVNLNSDVPDQAGAPAPLLITGAGRYREGDFDLKGRVDSPLQLMNREQPYRVDVRARAGATLARATGSLRSAVQFQDFDVDFLLSGDDLSALYPLLGLALPETPPYQLEGRLSHASDVWRYRDFAGRLGDSDVAGDVSIDVRGERPRLSGALASRRLDFDDLAGLIGANPQTGEGETASQDQRERAAARAARPTVLPDSEFNLQKLRSMDADVKIQAASINSAKLPLDSLTARVRLDDGMMQIEPLQIGTAGGTLSGKIVLDASVDPIATTTDLEVRNVQLPKVFPKMKSGSTGVIAGQVQLAGTGNSVAKMLGTADGNIDLVMGPAKVSNLLVELAGLDIAEALRYAIGKDRMIGVRCAYTQLNVDEGLMTSQALVFDTTDTAIVGAGTINMSNERLNLELRPRPKDRSPVSLRVPLQIGGTFKDPSFTPKAGPLAARAAAAAVLYAIAPPAALLALIETGPGENVRCGEALAEAEIATGPVPAPKKNDSRG